MAGPGGREVGRLSVRVLPDTSNFAQSLQRYLDRIERRAVVNIQTRVDTSSLQRDMDRAISGLSRSATVDVNARVNQESSRRAGSNAADASGRGFGSRIGSAMDRGLRSLSPGFIGRNPVVQRIGAALAAGIISTAGPMIGAGIAGAIGAMGTVGVIGIGWSLFNDEKDFKKKVEKLKKDIGDQMRDSAKPMEKAFIKSFDVIRKRMKEMKPEFDKMFKTASKAVKPLTDGVMDLVENAMPGFNKMLDEFEKSGVFDGLETMLEDVGDGLSDFFDEIGKAGPEAKTMFEDLGKAIKGTLQIAGTVIRVVAEMYGTLREHGSNIKESFSQLGTVFDELPGNASKGLSLLWTNVSSWFTSIYNTASTWISNTVNTVVTWVTGLPGRASASLSSLWSSFSSWFTSIYNTASTWISNTVNTVVTWLTGLPGRASAALSGLVSSIVAPMSSAGGRMVASIRGSISSAVSVIRGLPGRARSALGNIGGILVSSGRSLVQGFINGIKSMIGKVAGAVKSAVGAARDFFPFSPAKEGPFSGKGYTTYSGAALMDGFRKGIVSNIPEVRSALAGGLSMDLPGMVGSVKYQGRSEEASSPFSGPLKLVVDGHEFTAFVDGRADRKVRSTLIDPARKGRRIG